MGVLQVETRYPLLGRVIKVFVTFSVIGTRNERITYYTRYDRGPFSPEATLLSSARKLDS